MKAAPPPKKQSNVTATPNIARHLGHSAMSHTKINVRMSPVKIITMFVFQVLVMLTITLPTSLCSNSAFKV
jgi:hypothetical protein